MKNRYLTNNPPRDELMKELRERIECQYYPKFSTCCDEIYRRITDWCTGCIIKAAIDEMEK